MVVDFGSVEVGIMELLFGISMEWVVEWGGLVWEVFCIVAVELVTLGGLVLSRFVVGFSLVEDNGSGGAGG